MRPDIEEFFNRYCAAFNALDGDAIARLYAVPSGIASDTGYLHWPSFEPIRDNMIALCKLYRDNGSVSASYEASHFIPQGAQYAVADLHWRIQRTEGLAPWVFNTTYNLIRTPDGWRVLLCTAYSEQKLNTSSGT